MQDGTQSEILMTDYNNGATPQTPDIILSRLQDNKKSDISKIEGTFNFDVLSANSIEFAKAYAELSMILQASFANTAWGDYLTMRAAEYGIDRKQAEKSKVILTFVGQSGAKIIKGSLAETVDGIQFYTDTDAITNDRGIATVSAHCAKIGMVGNVARNTITKIPYSIPNIISVSNAAAAYDGFDEETDEQLLKRYMLAIRTPATSGNIYHYQKWAMAVDGVGNCKVLPLWNGNGTVKIIIINSNGQTASPDLIKKVHDYIESKRPIGATVTIASPTPYPINISATITGTYNLDKIKQNISDYLRQNVLNIKKISIAKIGAILIDSGITDYDYTTLLLNGANKDIDITDDILPCVGKVQLTNGK